MPFDLNNKLWNYNKENFQNVNVHKSLPKAPTNQAFNIPMGNSGKTYQAPVVYPNSERVNCIVRQQPLYNETTDPTQIHEEIINADKLAGHDARASLGKDISFERRIANMDIQFNKQPIYPIIAIAGLFIGALFLARMVK